MKLHEREHRVNLLSSKLSLQLAETMAEEDLTPGERLRIVSEVYSNYLGHMAKYMIREERHGDPNKCGGLAYEEEKKEFDVEGFLKDSDPPPKPE